MSRYQLETRKVQCPYCWEKITLQLDASAGSQHYTEDCHVCCQPILVHMMVDEDTGRIEVDAEPES